MLQEELMIGDWVFKDVNYDEEDPMYSRVDYQPFQIENGEDINLAIESNCFGDAGVYKPIPITPEILEKNGFKKFDFRNIEGQHEWSWWIDTQTSVTLWTRASSDNPENGWMVRIESPVVSFCIKIEYIHQLQHALKLCGINKEIIL